MSRSFLPRALLLDFYGTIVEGDDVPFGRICEKISEASPLSIAAVEVGSYWSQIFAQFCSQSFGAAFRSQRELDQLTLQRVLQHFKADLDADALTQTLYEYLVQPTIFPESREVLAQCRIPTCLVSNIDNADLQSALRHNDLSFDWVVTSEDCRAYKPRGEIFERALSLIDLSREEVLHVGDSLSSDVRGAKSQGIPALWINRRKRQAPRGDDAPDYTSTDLTGLLDIFHGAI